MDRQACDKTGSWQGGVQKGHILRVEDSQIGSVLAATQEEMARLVKAAAVFM